MSHGSPLRHCTDCDGRCNGCCNSSFQRQLRRSSLAAGASAAPGKANAVPGYDHQFAPKGMASGAHDVALPQRACGGSRAVEPLRPLASPAIVRRRRRGTVPNSCWRSRLPRHGCRAPAGRWSCVLDWHQTRRRSCSPLRSKAGGDSVPAARCGPQAKATQRFPTENPAERSAGSRIFPKQSVAPRRHPSLQRMSARLSALQRAPHGTLGSNQPVALSDSI